MSDMVVILPTFSIPSKPNACSRVSLFCFSTCGSVGPIVQIAHAWGISITLPELLVAPSTREASM